MTNIILITNGSRPHLLDQTIETLYRNTPLDQFNATYVLDGCRSDKITGPNLSVLMADPACNIIGRLKNLGAYWSEKQFGRGEWLCFVDDDMAFMPGWLDRMIAALSFSNKVRILGGVRHPYHKPIVEYGDRHHAWELTDAVAGYCHFMRWSTWDAFGPYDAHAKGTGQSEDFAVCQKVVAAGGDVGYIHPPVMAHCGITDSSGKTILGAELIERVEGILYE